MLDNTDPDFDTARRLYKRCAYEALKALRATRSADEWIDLADSIAKVWADSDSIDETPQG
jgi:hypothetical protein